MRNIYLVNATGQLVRMSEQPFETETDLEAILAEHPELITDDLGDGDEPPRWLLVSRQAGVGSANWTNRWAVDILFLDEEAVPTLVEVKRGSNAELRRGIVAQILDYAANAVLSWSAETLQAKFAATCQGRGNDPDELLAEFLAGAMESGAFWEQAHTNLQAGKIRLVFAADEIPVELQRIVEFLRRQMQTASVFAVEVKRFGTHEHTSCVSHAKGQTALGRERSGKQTLSRESALEAVRELAGTDAESAVRRLMDWAESRRIGIHYDAESLGLNVTREGRNYNPVVVYVRGKLELRSAYLRKHPPFDGAHTLGGLVRRFSQLPQAAGEGPEGWPQPSVPLAALGDPSAAGELLALLDAYVAALPGSKPA